MSLEWKSFDPAPVLTIFGSIAVAMVTGLWAYLGGHKKAKSDVQGTLNSGFQILITELQEERAALMKIVREQDGKIEAMEEKISTQAIHIVYLEHTLRQHGIDLPSSG